MTDDQCFLALSVCSVESSKTFGNRDTKMCHASLDFMVYNLSHCSGLLKKRKVYVNDVRTLLYMYMCVFNNNTCAFQLPPPPPSPSTTPFSPQLFPPLTPTVYLYFLSPSSPHHHYHHHYHTPSLPLPPKLSPPQPILVTPNSTSRYNILCLPLTSLSCDKVMCNRVMMTL
jgi:hypothetical protein